MADMPPGSVPPLTDGAWPAEHFAHAVGHLTLAFQQQLVGQYQQAVHDLTQEISVLRANRHRSTGCARCKGRGARPQKCEVRTASEKSLEFDAVSPAVTVLQVNPPAPMEPLPRMVSPSSLSVVSDTSSKDWSYTVSGVRRSRLLQRRITPDDSAEKRAQQRPCQSKDAVEAATVAQWAENADAPGSPIEERHVETVACTGALPAEPRVEDVVVSEDTTMDTTMDRRSWILDADPLHEDSAQRGSTSLGKSPARPVINFATDDTAQHPEDPAEVVSQDDPGDVTRIESSPIQRLGSQASVMPILAWTAPWPCWAPLTGHETFKGSLLSDRGTCLDRTTTTSRITGDSEVVRYFGRNSSTTALAENQTLVSGDAIRGSEGFLQRLVLYPSSPARVFLDLVSVVVLAYDIVMIPLQTLFGLPNSEVFQMIVLVTTAFWTFDIPISCFTGFHKDGIIDMRLERIIPKYLRTWFFIDITVVSLDWIMLSLGADASKSPIGTLRGTKSLRLLRILRVLRLLRLLRFFRINDMDSFIRSEALLVGINIGKMLLVVIILNHYAACAWYAVGTAYAPGVSGVSRTWVDMLVEREGREPLLQYWYMTSMHWSLTQFTPASMEVVPTNVSERSFTICLIVFALVVFSSVVSSITSAMTHLRMMNHAQTVQDELLRRYITENRVSFRVGSLIYGFVRQTGNIQQKRVHEMDVASLRSLPNTLLMHLRADVFSPLLMEHPLFWHLSQDPDNTMLSEVCHKSMGEVSVSQGNEVFTLGDEAECMYFVVNGLMDYYYKMQADSAKVERGKFLCEPILWMRWAHRGRLVAAVATEVASLNAQKFREMLKFHPSTMRSLRRYVAAFAAYVREQHELKMAISDIFGDEWLCEIDEMAQEAFGHETGFYDQQSHKVKTGFKAAASKTLSFKVQQMKGPKAWLSSCIRTKGQH